MSDLLALPTPEPQFNLRAPVFTERTDGSVVMLEPWPDEIDLSTGLLGHTHTGVRSMRREGLRLSFDLVNTKAEYVLTGYDPERQTVRAARLYCTSWDAPAVEVRDQPWIPGRPFLRGDVHGVER